MAGRVHREFTQRGKGQLQAYANAEALVEDMIEIVRLICTLRDYLGLEHEAMRPGPGAPVTTLLGAAARPRHRAIAWLIVWLRLRKVVTRSRPLFR